MMFGEIFALFTAVWVPLIRAHPDKGKIYVIVA